MKTFNEMAALPGLTPDERAHYAALAGSPLVDDLDAAAMRLHAMRNALHALAAKLAGSPRAEELLIIETRWELRRIAEL